DLDEPGQFAAAQLACRELFDLTLEVGGSISGEHGLGSVKAGYLERQWGPAAVGAHRAIKRALDPKGLFNPGKKR
ncbi:MAG TPA: FAD-linked oxidase C-terminal domain-containing protein, partial [Gaiellales bacterium]|nr:FAD-linked oxidase C-terminal domain-containing protein [Gaiellales bacterium]